MEFRVLGPLEILDGELRLPLGGMKRRAVAALLLLEANRVVPSERLIDGVWGDDPPSAAAGSLQNHVLRLRRVLGDRLVTRAPGYLLRVEPYELDLDRFRRLVDDARAGEPAEAAALLREALALWRGPPLADLAGEPAGLAAGHLDELRLEAIELRVDADLELGHHAQLVAELEQLAAEHPFREHLRAQLLLSLYRSGRQAKALEEYAAARATLVGGLGAEPGPELRTLHQAILRHDPALGGPVAEAPGQPVERVEEARKTVTIVLADLAGTAPTDPEARREHLRTLQSAAGAGIATHGGHVGRSAEDRLLGVFGVPLSHDDDALRAVRAACELRDSMLVSRAVVVTGDVIAADPGDGRPLISGPPLEEADRLRAAARADDVLVNDRAWRLVRHAVEAESRDGARAVTEIRGDAEGVVRRLQTVLVGREGELAELMTVFDRVSRGGHAQLVTVLGPPGIGKTRLAREVVRLLSESATCIVGRTPAYDDAPPFAPLRDALAPLAGGRVTEWAGRVLAGEPDGELLSARIAAAVAEAPSTGTVEETAWATRRLLETLARNRPVVFVLEDLHWAASAFLDLVEHVAQLGRGPILLLALARPELLDARPDWGGGGLNASSIRLGALPAGDAILLLDRLAEGVALDPDRRPAILDAAAGNPLFLEHLLVAALEGDESVPDSIRTLLAARLDRLGAEERRVAQAAAVYGEQFPAPVIQSIVDDDPRPVLLRLARRDFVALERPDELGDEVWGYRHALVRDEAYASIPKRRRARLHERIAELVAERAEVRGVEADGLIGHHLEAAFLATREIDPQAPELPRLAAGAAERLEAAGRRAFEQGDMESCAPLLGRAIALLSPDDASRLPIVFMLAPALGWIGRREEGLEILEAAARSANADDRWAQARLSVLRHHQRLFYEPGDPARVVDDANRAIAVLADAGDDEGLASAYILLHQASDQASVVHNAQEYLARAREHARAAGARMVEGLAASWLCIVLRRGRLPVDEAKRLVTEILDDPPTRYARASALGGLADLRAMEGAFDEARVLVAENHAIIEELGLLQSAAADLIAVADVEILAGDLEAAERILHEALDRLGRLHDRVSTANAAWRLALVLLREGRDDEAEALLEQYGEADAGRFVHAWRCVLGATVAARRGEAERSLELLHAAERSLEPLDESGMHVDAFLQAADALTSLGRTADAADRLRRSAGIARRLGYVVAERRAEAGLAELGAGPGT
ncbi:MAG: BTAD domain-containing putative transcriptional regulator [Verrucomicrobiota bacterium]